MHDAMFSLIHSSSLFVRLHMMCNGRSGGNNYDVPTRAERELIKRLEEATDEIEVLLAENQTLTNVSNELRFELSKSKEHRLSSRTDPLDPPINCPCSGYQETMLDAIMNDQSRSCDSQSQDDREVVACIGHKPPVSSAADYRPSRTAYVSQSFV